MFLLSGNILMGYFEDLRKPFRIVEKENYTVNFYVRSTGLRITLIIPKIFCGIFNGVYETDSPQTMINQIPEGGLHI